MLRFGPAAAARASSVGAHREAAEQYARTLRYAGGLPVEAQAQLCDMLSYEHYLTGDFDDAIAATRQALERYRALGDVLMEGDCLRVLSRLLWSYGRTREANETGLEAVSLLESLTPGRELASAYDELASLALIVDDFAGVFDWGARAVALAERLDERELIASARLTMSARGLLLRRANGSAGNRGEPRTRARRGA